jgi:hypothetical protein
MLPTDDDWGLSEKAIGVHLGVHCFVLSSDPFWPLPFVPVAISRLLLGADTSGMASTALASCPVRLPYTSLLVIYRAAIDAQQTALSPYT